jgi:ribosome biogenesis GTPase A
MERNRRRGIVNRPVRAMIAGIPNVGKSTFINSFAGRAAAKTGDRPGVTKGKQWIRLNKNVELLDTPGILWPKFDDQEVGKKLALIGSMRDEITDAGELAVWLIRYLMKEYPDALEGRYQVEPSDDMGKVLAEIAQRRGCLKAGGEADLEKASRTVVEDFRSGRLGKLTLEKV